MAKDAVDERWSMLPGPRWETSLQARTWLIEQRRLLDWSHKDVEKAFSDCARKSDLYSGPGGGDLFNRATERRVARFEREGQDIPDWMFWMPLAIEYAHVPFEDRWDWERENIPANGDVRREQEEEDHHSHLLQLDDDEIALIQRVREMSADERQVLRFMAQPDVLRWWIDCLKRADQRGTSLSDLVEKALGEGEATSAS